MVVGGGEGGRGRVEDGRRRVEGGWRRVEGVVGGDGVWKVEGGRWGLGGGG